MRGVASPGLALSLIAALSIVPAVQAPTQASTIQPAALPPVVEVKAQDARGMSLTFTLPDLEIADVTIAGRAFQAVAIPGGGQQGEVGEPAVPSFTRFLAVPEGASVQADAVPLEREELTGMHLAPVAAGDGEDFAYDEAAYARAGAPTADVLVSEPMILRDLRVVALTFLPVRYDPAAGTLTVTREMQVSIEFTGGGSAAISTRHRTIPPSFDQLYRSLIVNYPGAEALGAAVTPGTWLAICPNDTAVTNRLSHLVAWRQRKGSPVVVATTAQTGSTNAQIKSYIQTAFDTWPVPPEYVVLVGDAQAPYSIPTWYEGLSGYSGEGDHPYTTLAGFDILADVHIGRLSFSSLSELLVIVNKVVGYESQPYVSDPTWFTRACGVGDPASSGPSTIECMQWMKTRLLNIGFTQVDTVFSGSFVSQMTTAFNRGDAIIGYRGWIGMSGWGNANTYQLTNGWRMPFAAIMTCGTGSFAGETSRSEGFLRAGSINPNPPYDTLPKGAIGAIGLSTSGTHTRYNNCLFFGTIHGLIEDRLNTMGAALTRGKLENFLNYYAVLPQWAEIYAYWPNLMGDPAVDVWTAFPGPLAVDHPVTIAVGSNAATVTVSQDQFRIPGALVCLSKGQESYTTGITDANGTVELAINAATPGSMLLTASKHDMQPYLATISVVTPNVHVGYQSSIIDDVNGSDDGIINPGESIGLSVQVRNTGTTLATGVSATLTTSDRYVTILDGSETFPNIGAGGSAWTVEDFDFQVALDCPHAHPIRFGLDVTTAQGQYHSVIDLAVASADFLPGAITLYNAGNGRLDPGETVDMSLVLSNKGAMTAAGVSGTLIPLTNFVSAGDPNGTFGTIVAGGSGDNSADRFTLTAAASTYGGYLANFKLVTDFSGGITDTTIVSLTVGQRATTDPVGPDRYGYYAFDNTDTAYPEAPIYSWIELDPDFGGSGATEVVLGDFGDEQDRSRIIDLPFPFRYYGQTYTRATVCSNGWVALGETYLTSYRNWTIPGSGGPSAMVAVFWDELYQVSGTSQCYQKYDTANHRWILEWSRFRNLSGGGDQIFEVIFYDPAYHPTDTGDGIIVMQYSAASSSDGTDGYATAGIEDATQTDGVLYTYFNRYPLGAAPVASGRAVKYLPLLESNMGTIRGAARNTFNSAPLPSTEVTVLGSGRSFLTGADGTYSGFVPAGTYDMVAAHAGFRPDTASSVVVVEGEVTVVDFALTDIAGPAITTTTHPHTANDLGPYPIPVHIVEYSGLVEKTLYYAANGGPYTALPLTPTGGDDYLAQIPGQPYTTLVTYYVYARDAVGNASVDPPGAPGTTFSFWVAPMTVVVDDAFEAVSSWTVGAPDDDATTGIWVRTDPVGTVYNTFQVQPENDHTPDPGAICYVTGNGTPGEEAGVNDVDNGKTTLFSPVFDLESYSTATVSYWLWYTNDRGNSPGQDSWVVDVTSDGSSWASLENTTASTNAWVERSFVLDAAVPLTSTVQFRFVASDYSPGSLVEAAIDDFMLTGMRIPLGVAAPEVMRRNGLDPCRPNPFNPRTTIGYRVAAGGPTSLGIYDVSGRVVRTLVDGHVEAGEHSLVWDGTNGAGQAVASGIYFLRLETGDFMQVRQLTLVR